jgi:molecular chaperone GrpE
MDDPRKEQPTNNKFSDKRRRLEPELDPMMDPAQDSPATAPETEESEGSEEQVEINYLEDLRRVQAEFDNYRKRMLREQTQLAQRASARLIGSLLPILDNFESAISHGEGGSGVELVYRELKKLLEDEGLEEIEAEGTPFDPMKHEAFEAVPDDSVDEPTVRSVLRRGYAFKGQVMRPSMVSVARPPEGNDEAAEKDAAEG